MTKIFIALAALLLEEEETSEDKDQTRNAVTQSF